MLQVNNIEVAYYDRLVVLRGVSIKVEEGKIVSILGPNGSGKSTLLKSIMGLIDGQPRKGEIIFKGKKINGKGTEEIVDLGISFVGEEPTIFQDITVKENIMLCGNPSDEIIDVFRKVWEKRNELARNLSGGEQKLLSLMCALIRNPELIILDEPSLGLSPKMVEEIYSIIEKMKGKKTFLIAEQNPVATERIADYLYIIENGKIVYEGKDFKENKFIKEIYFGEEKETIKGWKLYKTKRRW